MVSRVHGFEATGYLVLRVRGCIVSRITGCRVWGT